MNRRYELQQHTAPANLLRPVRNTKPDASACSAQGRWRWGAAFHEAAVWQTSGSVRDRGSVDHTIAQFVRSLRRSDVRVSPAETLDALRIAAFVGVRDPRRLRAALSMALAKSVADKARFDACYDRFFAFDAFNATQTRSHLVAPPDADPTGHAGNVGSSSLAGLLIREDKAVLSTRLARAAVAAQIDSMQALRDKSGMVQTLLQSLDIASLDAVIERTASGDAGDRDTAQWLRGARARLQREIRDYVEAQYRVHVDASGRRGVLAAALQARLTSIQPAYYDDVAEVVRRIAAKLTRQHRRRRLRARRGMLDLRRTLRRNLAYDGALFDLQWRRTKVQKPKVFAVCDVSGSVARMARFTLLLLYSLNELLPNVRTFAFSSQLGEVTALFEASPIERAIEEALFLWGKGTTDYARAFSDLRGLCLKDIDRRSTVIIVGDARNNYFDPRPQLLAEISRRAKQVLWLNPEARDQWRTGDSEMARFAPFCFRVDPCNSLQDLERFADQLLLSNT